MPDMSPQIRRRLHVRVRDDLGRLQSLDVSVTLSARSNRELDAKWRQLQADARVALRGGRGAELRQALGITPRGHGSEVLEDDGAVTLADVWRSFERTRLPENSPRERENKRQVWRQHIEPVLGQRVAGDLTTTDVLAWRARLVERLSPKTVNNYANILRVIMAWGVQLGAAEGNPAEAVAPLKARSVQRDRGLQPAEIERLIPWARQGMEPERALLIEVQFTAGLRDGEVVAMEKEDFDPSTGVLTIRRNWSWKKGEEAGQVKDPKGHQVRQVCIARGLGGYPLAQALWEHILRQPGQLVFPGFEGHHLHHTALGRWVARACAGAGVRRISPHGLRHSCGAYLAHLGLSQAQIARYLGHRQVSTSERYTATASAVELAHRAWGFATVLIGASSGCNLGVDENGPGKPEPFSAPTK